VARKFWFRVTRVAVVAAAAAVWLPRTRLGDVVRSFAWQVAGFFVVVGLGWWLDFVRGGGKFQKFLIGLSAVAVGAVFGFVVAGKFARNSVPPVVEEGNFSKFLFANLWKNNFAVEEIRALVARENPDAVFFVEFLPQHEAIFSGELAEEFPFFEVLQDSEIRAKTVVASRLPIREVRRWRGPNFWMVPEVVLDRGGEDFSVFVVHTSSPVSLEFFRRRNQQLAFLENLGVKFTGAGVVVGDRNVSVWSQFFPEKMGDFEFVEFGERRTSSWGVPVAPNLRSGRA